MRTELMTLGSFVFGVPAATFQEMRRAAEYRWEAPLRGSGWGPAARPSR